MKSKIVTPHAAVMVWNYRDRISSNGVKLGSNEIEQTIISTVSLISVSTSKEKSAPHGQFELTLAPTKNWVATLTPGSWMCIMMSLTPIEQQDFKKANSEKVKMFGRIDTVRADVSVDQTTGARITTYKVNGPDWGQVFNTSVYVDPLARYYNSDISTAARMIYEQTILDARTKGLPTSRQNLEALINIWGNDKKDIKAAEQQSSVVLKPSTRYELPKEVSDFFGFKNTNNEKLIAVSDIISQNIINGPLSKYDTYKKDTIDGIGLIQPGAIFGNNNFWQLINDNCNNVLNEVICDIRWENGEAKLALYNRIKPFIVRNNFAGKNKVIELLSMFKNIRCIDVPEEQVVAINAGTNWRDKYNFLELQIDYSLIDDVRQAALKQESQSLDEEAIRREGLRPMFIPVKYLPQSKKDGTIDPFQMVNWKHLIRQWYFDTHRMLNGSISFTGISQYIQVGDNIKFAAKLLAPNNNTSSANLSKNNDAFILAHVESISNTFSVDPTSGARSYFTTVNFVRAIFVDKNREPLQDLNQLDEGFLDVDAEAVPVPKERNRLNTISTSEDEDPDVQKYRGN